MACLADGKPLIDGKVSPFARQALFIVPPFTCLLSISILRLRTARTTQVHTHKWSSNSLSRTAFMLAPPTFDNGKHRVGDPGAARVGAYRRLREQTARLIAIGIDLLISALKEADAGHIERINATKRYTWYGPETAVRHGDVYLDVNGEEEWEPPASFVSAPIKLHAKRRASRWKCNVSSQLSNGPYCFTTHTSLRCCAERRRTLFRLRNRRSLRFEKISPDSR